MTAMDQNTALLEGFIEEAAELLARSEKSLEALDHDTRDAEAINELFRAIHTFKGSAGMLDLDHLVYFSHVFEDLLMQVRDGDISLDANALQLCFQCVDQLSMLVDTIHDQDCVQLSERQMALIKRLESLAHCGGETDAEHPHTRSALAPQPSRDNWHISLRFHPDLFDSGFDPEPFIRYLEQLGSIEDLAFIDQGIPVHLSALPPTKCLFGIEINFKGHVDKATLAGVFDCIKDLCEVRILPPDSALADYLALIASLPEDDLKLGEILVRIGALTEQELAQCLSQQSQNQPSEPLGKLAIEQHKLPPELVEASLAKQAQTRKNQRQHTFLRVSADKMDSLISQVGELVISAAGAEILSAKRDDPELREMLEGLHHQVELIRETALQLRMVEINETFNRFNRIVRETSSTLHKDIKLHVSGGDTELDKNLVSKLYDPLVHLVRNAIDHGIETPAEREAAGKQGQGALTLSAKHASGMIVIEVRDDGRGIDAQRIREKAINQGLISAQDELSEQDTYQLIFHPGFSTAQQVSDLSGRGVGLDSVKRDLEQLRGTIEIESTLGEGSCFRIKMPLTLAIIEGFLVGAGDQKYVIPVEWVDECIETPALEGGKNGAGYMELRGAPLPYIALSEVFDIAAADTDRRSMVVISDMDASVGIIVDVLHGETQSVIKPMGPMFEGIMGIAGSTILGSGEVALTLDVPDLIRLIKQRHRATRAA